MREEEEELDERFAWLTALFYQRHREWLPYYYLGKRHQRHERTLTLPTKKLSNNEERKWWWWGMWVNPSLISFPVCVSCHFLGLPLLLSFCLLLFSPLLTLMYNFITRELGVGWHSVYPSLFLCVFPSYFFVREKNKTRMTWGRDSRPDKWLQKDNDRKTREVREDADVAPVSPAQS